MRRKRYIRNDTCGLTMYLNCFREPPISFGLDLYLRKKQCYQSLQCYQRERPVFPRNKLFIPQKSQLKYNDIKLKYNNYKAYFSNESIEKCTLGSGNHQEMDIVRNTRVFLVVQEPIGPKNILGILGVSCNQCTLLVLRGA